MTSFHFLSPSTWQVPSSDCLPEICCCSHGGVHNLCNGERRIHNIRRSALSFSFAFPHSFARLFLIAGCIVWLLSYNKGINTKRTVGACAKGLGHDMWQPMINWFGVCSISDAKLWREGEGEGEVKWNISGTGWVGSFRWCVAVRGPDKPLLKF